MKITTDTTFRPYTLTIENADEHRTLMELSQKPNLLKVMQHDAPHQSGIGRLQTCSDLPFKQQQLLRKINDHITATPYTFG